MVLFMVKRIPEEEQMKLGIRSLDFNIPEDHISRFVVEFVDEYYQLLGVKENKKKKGRDSFPVKEMLKLLIYAKIEHIDSMRFLADMVKYHDIYKFVGNGICPSERSLQRYREKYGKYFNELLKATLKKASDARYTDFNEVSIDGTIKKAYNSKNKVITEKETEILTRYLEGDRVSQDELDKLHKPAREILENKKISTQEKLYLLDDIKTQFTLSGQKSVPVTDIEARWMKSKKGNSQISYNIQSAVDYNTKMICAINVVQSPTDHYQLPKIVDKAINNTNIIPRFVMADTIYLNEESLSYLADNQINGVIPDRKQSKEKIGRLNKNPYHKDHFKYLPEIDAFECPEGQIMYFFNKYLEKNDDSDNPDKIKRLYSNYSVCKACNCRENCLSPTQTHRTITEYGGGLKKAMWEKMETEEYKEEYAKRSSVEGPFGILKEQFHIESEVVIGKAKTEERILLDAVAYNLIRLFNLEQEMSNDKEDIVDFCEKISVQEKLELRATIF